MHPEDDLPRDREDAQVATPLFRVSQPETCQNYHDRKLTIIYRVVLDVGASKGAAGGVFLSQTAWTCAWPDAQAAR